jgi:ABC-type amino acid transport substrate-binding protein
MTRFFFLLVTALLFSLPAQADDYKSAFDRVMATNTIRCGYIVYPPALSKDPNTGHLSGATYEIMEKLAGDLGLKVEWAEEVGSGSWQEGLRQGRYDMLCNTIAATTSRARVALSSDPVYFITYDAYVRADDRRFDDNISLADSPDISIAVIDGSTAEQTAQNVFPRARLHSLPDLTDFVHLLLEVQTGKADLTISDGAQMQDFERKNPGEVRRVSTPRPLLVVPGSFFFALNEFSLAAMINTGLRNLQFSGFVDKILDSYKTQTGSSFRRVAPPYQ